MLRIIVIAAALAASLSPSVAAAAAKVKLLPGLTYERVVRSTPAGKIVEHVMIGPKPGGLWELRPVLARDRITGRETVTDMQRRLAPVATAAGVNGDLFNFDTGHPSGILFRDGLLDSRPLRGRSSLGIGFDGLLRIARIKYFGTVRFGESPRRQLHQFNRPLTDDAVGLFVPTWGERTPEVKGAVDVILDNLAPTVPNTPLSATVVAVRSGGGTAIPSGGGVVQATGSLADSVREQALAGVPVTVELRLTPWWGDVRDAIGGGPLIVREGRAVRAAGEDFLRSQIGPRNPRTAVGQRADGRIIMIAIDGRQSISAGLTVADLAGEMVRLGAVTAMALDAGGSTTLAFDGNVLNSPSDGRERPVGDSFQFLYYGVYAPPPRSPVISPNGDGFRDFQKLSYKLVRPAEVDARLVAPDGSIFWQETGLKEPGTYPLRLAANDGNPSLPEGRWRWVVVSTDADGRVSGFERRFAVNNSLAMLRLSRRQVALHPRRGGRLTIRFRLDSAAKVRVTIAKASGAVRKFRLGKTATGAVALIWDGRVRGKKVAKAGRYRVTVTARNATGRVQLFGDVIVKRKAKPRFEVVSRSR